MNQRLEGEWNEWVGAEWKDGAVWKEGAEYEGAEYEREGAEYERGGAE